MSKKDFDPGEFICEGATDEVRPWIYYLLAALGLIFGAPFLFASVPLLWGRLKGDFEGGIAGVLMSLIFVVGGVLAFRSARSKSTIFAVRFFENAVEVGSSGAGARRSAYDDLAEFAVVVRVPSTVTQVSAVAKGVVSLVAGNALGVGAALANTTSGGVVVLKSPSHGTLIIPRISVEHASRIAKNASIQRGEEVLTYDS